MRSATESIAEFACDSGIAGGFAGGLGCSWAACETSSLLWARACAFGPGGGFGVVELLGAVELNDGAVAGGSSGTGFCAVWQAQPARVSPSRIATRIWMSTTRIFIYEIEPGSSSPALYQKSYLANRLWSTFPKAYTKLHSESTAVTGGATLS